MLKQSGSELGKKTSSGFEYYISTQLMSAPVLGHSPSPTMSTSQFDLLSTTRCDPQLLELPWNTSVNASSPSPYLLLSYHCDRLRDAAALHHWPVPQGFSLSALENLCEAALKDARAEAEDSVPREHYRVTLFFTSAPHVLTAGRSVSSCLAPVQFP